MAPKKPPNGLLDFCINNLVWVRCTSMLSLLQVWYFVKSVPGMKLYFTSCARALATTSRANMNPNPSRPALYRIALHIMFLRLFAYHARGVTGLISSLT
jgi:hypothetical protein